MKHVPLKSLEGLAGLSLADRPMTHRERLTRWAQVLEREPQRRLRPLVRVELYCEPERALLRADDTPIAAAYADPVLRADGLRSDRLGEARTYFGLTGGDIHALVCDCRYGGRMRAGDVARRLRALAHPNPLVRFWTRVWM
ncbi:MAG: hypothetical protein ACREEW_01460 [Caulobacteraceae bacterium]